MQSHANKAAHRLDEFIASAAAEKMASFMTLDYLKAEAAKGQRSDFERYMASAPNAPAEPGDALTS